jgi:hypothetical protein
MWYKGFFEFEGETFRLVSSSAASAATSLFDYVADDTSAPSEPIA